MARSGFLRNLRTAAGFLSADRAIGFNGDQNKLARVLKSAAIWLTPSAGMTAFRCADTDIDAHASCVSGALAKGFPKRQPALGVSHIAADLRTRASLFWSREIRLRGRREKSSCRAQVAKKA